MKKTLLFMAIVSAAPGAVFAATTPGCPTGYTATDQYVFFSETADTCPSGYTEVSGANAKITITDGANCGSGYTDSATLKEAVCDSSKGECKNPIGATDFTCQ